MDNIYEKINKYSLKLKRNTDPEKGKIYNEKIKHYKSMIKKGGSISDIIDKRGDEVLEAVENIKASITGNDVQAQLDELMKSSEEALNNYNNLGNAFREATKKYMDITDQVIDKARNKTFESDYKLPEDNVNDIKSNLERMTGSPDDLIISSLIRDIKDGKDVSNEVELYGLTDNEEIKNARSNQGQSTENVETQEGGRKKMIKNMYKYL